jgi:two-component system chemotaxis response regulator CheB
MKILLLNPLDSFKQKLQEHSCTCETDDLLVEEELILPSELCGIDVIAGGGEASKSTEWIDSLLAWRTHPHTYLIPCRIDGDETPFEKRCLWPRLSVDHFCRDPEHENFSDWLNMVARWQMSRMDFSDSDSLGDRGPLEILTSLALRKATGKLSVFDEEGVEGAMYFKDACLVGAGLSHLRGSEALFDFLTWTRGNYIWEECEHSKRQFEPLPLYELIYQGLKLIRDANLFFHFTHDLDCPITRTESESALDDGAIPFFAEQNALYQLIDGPISPIRLIEASPLSRPRTMNILAKWFSLGDIKSLNEETPTGGEELQDNRPVVAAQSDRLPEQLRVLIVDDSHLMCKVLKSIFSEDPRFEVVGTAHDGIEALSLLDRQKPDIVTLDMQMPRMDGLTALKHIMVRNPKPVVVLSAFTKDTSLLTYESFKYGAVDVLTKPSNGTDMDMARQGEEIRSRIVQAAHVRIEAAQYIRRKKSSRIQQETPAKDYGSSWNAGKALGCIAAVYCGSGGFPSLLKLLFGLSQVERYPATIICAAMPRQVVEALAPSLQKDCGIRIEKLLPDAVLKNDTCYIYSYEECFILQGGIVKMERALDNPAAEGPFDRLLISIGSESTGRVVALALSGAESDGIYGMRHVLQNGGLTYVPSPELCLQPELPRRLLADGIAQEVTSMNELPHVLEKALKSTCLIPISDMESLSAKQGKGMANQAL